METAKAAAAEAAEAAIGEAAAAESSGPAAGVEVAPALTTEAARERLPVERRSKVRRRQIAPAVARVLLPPRRGTRAKDVAVVIGVDVVAVVGEAVASARSIRESAIHAARVASVRVARDTAHSALHHAGRGVVRGARTTGCEVSGVRVEVAAAGADTARTRNGIVETSSLACTD